MDPDIYLSGLSDAYWSMDNLSTLESFIPQCNYLLLRSHEDGTGTANQFYENTQFGCAVYISSI